MRLTALAFSGIAAVLLAASPALAEEGRDPIAVVEHIFEMADADGSGTLTPEEYYDAKLQRYGVTFEACDLDADGETSLSEYLDVYLRFHPSTDRSKI